MISISKAVLKAEIELAQRILKKWELKLDDGIPDVDLPASEDSLDAYLRELCGEFLVIAGKMETIANVLAEDRNS